MKEVHNKTEKALCEINHGIATPSQEPGETLKLQEAGCLLRWHTPDIKGVYLVSEQIIKRMAKTHEGLEYFKQISENSITCQNETHSNGNGSTGKYSSVITGNRIIDADRIRDR